MKREFLKNFQVNGQPLPDAVIDAIMQENARDLEAAKANPGEKGEGGKTFTQDEVNRIVSERLARDRAGDGRKHVQLQHARRPCDGERGVH